MSILTSSEAVPYRDDLEQRIQNYRTRGISQVEAGAKVARDIGISPEEVERIITPYPEDSTNIEKFIKYIEDIIIKYRNKLYCGLNTHHRFEIKSKRKIIAFYQKLSQVTNKYSYSLICLYAILVLWILYCVELENTLVAWRNLKWIFIPLSWKSFISPSAVVFNIANILTIFVPIIIILIIPIFFDKEQPTFWNKQQYFYKRRYLWAALAIISLFVLMFILTIIIWGSYPVIIDEGKNIRLRMIPFIPWPNYPLLK
jgi:hypothetical protein